MGKAWFIAVGCIASVCAAQSIAEVPKPGPIPEAPPGSFDYPSVATALDALRAKPGTSIREQAGWIIVEEKDSASPTLWSFTPLNHPAHPSAIKRQLVSEGGQVNLHMTVQCEATKAACDALVREFEDLNQQMIKAIGGR